MNLWHHVAHEAGALLGATLSACRRSLSCDTNKHRHQTQFPTWYRLIPFIRSVNRNVCLKRLNLLTYST
jgi:hypothetical protein